MLDDVSKESQSLKKEFYSGSGFVGVEKKEIVELLDRRFSIYGDFVVFPSEPI